MKTNQKLAEHYTWGENCDGWHLLKSDRLSIIQERMPPGTEEKLHFHHHAQQFFFVLNGIATFELMDSIVELHSNEGLHIQAMQKHKISNKGNVELNFLVISEPKSHGDRTNLE